MKLDTNYPTVTSKRGDIKIPCMITHLIDTVNIMPNHYNPNAVNSKNMDLLMESITQNGFCFPIVVIWGQDEGKYIIVDGFHRFTIATEYLGMVKIPVVILDHNLIDRMTATIQFNKARGVHGIEPMVKMVKSLLDQGMTKEEIMVKLGMEVEEIDRLASVGGIADIFKNVNYSTAFTMVEFDDAEVN